MTFAPLTRCGLAIESQISSPAWPSASPATVSALLPILAPTPEVIAPLSALSTMSGYGPVTQQTQQTLPANLTVPFEVQYEGFEALWACALGYMARRHSSTMFPETIVSGAYRHRYEMDRVLQAVPWEIGDGWAIGSEIAIGQRKTRRLTVAATTGNVAAWEWLSAMVGQVTLRCGRAEPMIAETQFLAASLDTTPATNTLNALQALTPPTAPRVLWHQGVTRIGAYSASVALDSNDVIAANGFTMTLNNALNTSYSPRLTLTSEEFTRGATPPAVTGAFVVPRYTADTLLDGQRAGTTYMADLIFTGEDIGATGESYTLEFYWPTIKFTNAGPAWHGASMLGETLAFTASIPSAAAAGMPTTIHATPLIVQLQSSVSTHPLE